MTLSGNLLNRQVSHDDFFCPGAGLGWQERAFPPPRSTWKATQPGIPKNPLYKNWVEPGLGIRLTGQSLA